MTDRPSPEDVIRHLAADSVPDEVKVAAYGRVVSYDHEKAEATVRPVIDPVFFTASGEKVSVASKPIEGVPVQWTATAKAGLALPLDPGDLVLLVIRDRDHDAADESAIPRSGGLAARSARRFSWSDAVAFPVRGGPHNAPPAGATHATDAVLFLDGSRALRVGDASASLRTVVAEVLHPWLQSVANWAAAHNHPSNTIGAPSGPSLIPFPPVPSISDLASGRLLISGDPAIPTIETPEIPESPEPPE